MEKQKRMIQTYEVTQSIKIGSKEIVIGIDEDIPDGMKYICGFVERNDIMERYLNVMASDNYPEIVALYGERVNQAAKEFIDKTKNLSETILTEKDCIPDNHDNDIHGKVVVRNAKELRPEYQRAEYQLYFVTGGFGAYGKSRGSAVFCINLHSGENTRIERMEVLGELKPECLPEWAKEAARRHTKNYKHRSKEAAR